MTTVRAVRPGELDEMYELMAASYPKWDAASIRRVIESDPTFRPELSRVVEIDGRLVARLGILDREIYFEGDILRAGAISFVCTAPAYRRKGLCWLLLDDGTEVMRKGGFDLSFLFGAQAVYGKSGWQPLSAFEMQTNLKFPPCDGITSRQADVESDLPFLMRVYEQFNRRLKGPMVRSEKYWQNWILKPTAMNSGNTRRLFIIERKGEALGYVVRRSGDPSHIAELAWERDMEDAMPRVLDYILCSETGSETRLHCDLPELYEYAAKHSVPPMPDEIRQKQPGICRIARSCGLFKLIGGPPDRPCNFRDTQALLTALRTGYYNFWKLDGF